MRPNFRGGLEPGFARMVHASCAVGANPVRRPSIIVATGACHGLAHAAPPT